MNINKLFVVRHADYEGSGPDPVLSDLGKRQAVRLGAEIREYLKDQHAVIWTSKAARAFETANLIRQGLGLSELVSFEKLWSDNDHHYDFNWLKEEIENFKGENLIIVSHLEYVRDFPAKLGFYRNSAGYAEGFVVDDGKYEPFPS